MPNLRSKRKNQDGQPGPRPAPRRPVVASPAPAPAPAPVPPRPTLALRPLAEMPEPKTKAEALSLSERYKERAARSHAKALKFAEFRKADLKTAAKLENDAEGLPDFEAEIEELYQQAKAELANENGGGPA